MVSSLDFLQQVVDCHWGQGCWLALANGGSTPSQPGTEFDFIDVAGGTPGFIIPQAFHASPGPPYQQALAFITLAQLSLKAQTLAGHPVTGLFGEWFNLFNGGGSTLWIGLSTFPKKFTIRVSTAATGTPGAIVSLYKPNMIKAGIDPTGLTPTAASSSLILPATVTVDQKALTVG